MNDDENDYPSPKDHEARVAFMKKHAPSNPFLNQFA